MTEPQQPEPLDAELVEDPPPAPQTDYTDAGVPTFDYVRDQIENRVATTTGTTELTNESQHGRAVDQQFADRDKAGRDKLEEIRRSMRNE